MFNIIKKIFKKKEEPKKVEEEINQNKETILHTKSDLKSGLGE